MRTPRVLVGMIAVLALSACGGGGGQSANTTCSPSGQTLHVTAQNFAFDKTCYAVRAGQPFTIDFDNKDTAPHNFAIYTDSTASKALLKPPTVSASSTVYHGTALHPGTYYFQCDVHTSMHGTFIVK
jgi:plastocyanin